jgi:hypothetical protein
MPKRRSSQVGTSVNPASIPLWKLTRPRCDHDYPRWGGHTTIRSTATPPVLGAPATIVGPELPGKRAPALFLFPVPFWGFALRPGLAVQSPTRSAVPRSSNPDVTLDLGLIWTNVNLLPSGAMNRSNAL